MIINLSKWASFIKKKKKKRIIFLFLFMLDLSKVKTLNRKLYVMIILRYEVSRMYSVLVTRHN